MPTVSDYSAPGSTANDPDTLPTRRRPDRVDDVPESLIPLLRGSFGPVADDPDPAFAAVVTTPVDVDVMVDDLAPARGIMLGAALSAPIWALLALGIHVLLH